MEKHTKMTRKYMSSLIAVLSTLGACATPKGEKPPRLQSYTIVRSNTTNTQTNFYHPNIRGGVGRIFDDKAHDLQYVSGVANGNLGGDSSFTVLGHAIDRLDSQLNDASTVQAAYNPNNDWSFGGGVLKFTGTNKDVSFGRALYMHKTDDLELLVGGLVKEVSGDVQPGLAGMVGLRNFWGFQPVAGMQREKEQARYIGGLIFPSLTDQDETTKRGFNMQPALDVLYVDNQVGDIPGPQFTMANFTLGYNETFFPTKAKTGRLLGSTGIWAPNPLFGTDPSPLHNINFNKALDPAAMGNLLNIRYIEFDRPNGDKSMHLDALVFPTQFDYSHSILDNFFLGLSQDSFGDDHRTGPLFGATFNLLGFSGNFDVSIYQDEVQGSLNASVIF